MTLDNQISECLQITVSAVRKWSSNVANNLMTHSFVIDIAAKEDEEYLWVKCCKCNVGIMLAQNENTATYIDTDHFKRRWADFYNCNEQIIRDIIT